MTASQCGATEAVVYVIDDDTSMRAALEDLLASVGLAVHTFASVREFLEHERADAPGCLLLDVRMPEQSGMDFHQRMAQLGLRLPVVFITGHGDIAMGVKAIKRGAIEFLTKPFRDQELLDAIQQGIEQDRQRRSQEAAAAALQSRWQSLSEGERDVARLVAQGLLNKQVAAQLDLSEVTVKVRRGNVMRKMQAQSLADLVRLCEKLGV
ncbi:DNA-binding response regulator [Bordetella trematum]|uniref:Two component response regulator n=1 Tax=Bordetella trematum TaxID=123899 RepID=A0A157SJS2_9BORD|nr:response regulator transcription factor [Bordetella trematum]AZR93321.1 DNA-binding response regulator [Bordetella trematum]NNH20550.1 response regulator transcription factor [Bordetella trematum]SAI19533.1 two component response regulator [Bordetella trematum]SAI70708.1 two component response regulator [Bordetella trematum]SUV98631.1 two component response regulator [Bordetella trematum]